jgi:signal transduction histidine kinase
MGWGTIAYGVAAGICAGTAMAFLLIGAGRQRFDPLMASFGVFAAAGALNGVVTVRLHQSSSISDYEDWIKVFGFANLLTFPAVLLLVAAWTNSVPRWAFGALAVIGAPVVILQVVLPNGLIVDDVTGLREVALFGETFVVHEGTESPWRPFVEALVVSGAVISITALVRGFRRGRRPHAAVVTGTFLVALAVGLYDALVDFGVTSTTYLTPFGLMLASVGGAVFLAERTVRTDMRLVQQATQLEETVVERTAALVSTNRRLEEQLTRQRRSNRSLAALTDEFERSNATVDPTASRIEASLQSLLALLGSIVSAAAVELHIHDGSFPDLLPRSLSWHNPDCVDRPDTEPVEAPIEMSESIKIGIRPVGELVVRSIGEHHRDAESIRYLDLTAEHLAGLIQRLELVGLITDTAIETERQRIAMDLHDSVTQRMYSVSLLADAAAHQATVDPTNLAGPVQRIRELVLSSLAELRTLLFELRPDAFDGADLTTLIEQLVDNLDSTCEPDILVDLQPVPPMATPIKIALYRISQEALNNACRHSDCDRIVITLAHACGAMTLRIDDNGCGFEPATVKYNGAGLDNLRARADAIDADLEITSHPGTGTTITVTHTLATPPPAAAPVHTSEGAGA